VSLLNDQGNPTQDHILGAVNITLTQDQVNQAGSGNLWAQGGVPDDPVPAQEFYVDEKGNPLYGFGTLRCAADNVNGDNVEYISFPGDVRHVFCEAYYVNPSPTSGTITITKQVSGNPPDPAPEFHFGCPGITFGSSPACLTFDPGGFTLSNGGQAAFERAGGLPPTTPLELWTVTEDRVADYTTTVTCDAGTPAASGSVWTSSPSASGVTVTIGLAANEHVTCTYTNAYRAPPLGGLRITKITQGGTGTFPFDVTPTPGRVTLTTAESGEPNLAPSERDLQRHARPDQRAGDRDRVEQRGDDMRVRGRVHSRRLDLAGKDHPRRHRHGAVPGPAQVHRGPVVRTTRAARDHNHAGGRGRRRAQPPRERQPDRSPGARHLPDHRAATADHRNLDADRGPVQR